LRGDFSCDNFLEKSFAHARWILHQLIAGTSIRIQRLLALVDF
jgi:hypothetical protein